MGRAIVIVTGLILFLTGTGSAAGDPLPGFDLDPGRLEAKMDACLALEMGEQEILMGWRNLRDGEERHWRCSSLRHMMLDDHGPHGPHDPFVDVAAFMRCADKVVSYGFPRPGTPGNTVLHYQYNGTRNSALVVINDLTGDVVTIYTAEIDNDWIGCANGL